MTKTFYTYLIYLLAGIFFLFSCNKDSNNPSDDTYVASPQKLMSLSGKDWFTVEPGLSNKKGYLYSTLTQSQSLPISAVASLAAIEESDNAIHYNLLLNMSRQTNKVVIIDMTTVDSLNTIDKNEAYGLMLSYYNYALNTLTDTSLAVGNYEQPDGQQVTTRAADIVSKLNSGFETDLLSLSINANEGHFSMVTTKNTNGNYTFSYYSATN